MEVFLRDFLTDQIFGLNRLANLANFSVLLAFSVRGVLKLRILSLVADVVILPHYFQHKPLWPPIFWGVAFIIVNGSGSFPCHDCVIPRLVKMTGMGAEPPDSGRNISRRCCDCVKVG